MFETERLVVRPPEPDELQALLEVYASNPGYLALTEGSAGEPGRYDLGMLERDVTLAGLTPGRTLAGLFLRASGELAGVVDWMDENPEDRMPWIGLLMIRADRQHQGLATEAFDALLARFRLSGAHAVRAAVLARNEAGRAFAERLGFRALATRARRMVSEREELVVLERALRD